MCMEHIAVFVSGYLVGVEGKYIIELQAWKANSNKKDFIDSPIDYY